VVVTNLFCVWTIRWWPIVVGVSRHSWQQRSISVIIKGCRIKRRPEEDVNVGLTVGFYVSVMDLELVLYCILHFFYLSSPYLCVFGDDHVTRYMGVDVDAGEPVDT